MRGARDREDIRARLKKKKGTCTFYLWGGRLAHAWKPSSPGSLGVDALIGEAVHAQREPDRHAVALSALYPSQRLRPRVQSWSYQLCSRESALSCALLELGAPESAPRSIEVHGAAELPTLLPWSYPTCSLHMRGVRRRSERCALPTRTTLTMQVRQATVLNLIVVAHHKAFDRLRHRLHSSSV